MGRVKEPVKNYDLMNVTMICLGKPEGENYGGLLRMLEVLFGGRCTPSQVVEFMNDVIQPILDENKELLGVKAEINV